MSHATLSAVPAPHYVIDYINQAKRNHGSILVALHPYNVPAKVALWLGTKDESAGDMLHQEIFIRAFLGDWQLTPEKAIVE